jgi:hypothetical protein
MRAGTRRNNLKVVHLTTSRLDYVREMAKKLWMEDPDLTQEPST